MKPHQAVTTETQACQNNHSKQTLSELFCFKKQNIHFYLQQKLRRWFSFSCVCFCIYEESFVCPQTHTESGSPRISSQPLKVWHRVHSQGFLLVERIIDGLAVALTHQVLHPAGESFHTLFPHYWGSPSSFLTAPTLHHPSSRNIPQAHFDQRLHHSSVLWVHATRWRLHAHLRLGHIFDLHSLINQHWTWLLISTECTPVSAAVMLWISNTPVVVFRSERPLNLL